jgi:hypothetical protein
MNRPRRHKTIAMMDMSAVRRLEPALLALSGHGDCPKAAV